MPLKQRTNMIVETDRLITVANFAKMKEVTATAVYGWINQGKEKRVVIDGVQFVMMDIEDMKKYKNRKE